MASSKGKEPDFSGNRALIVGLGREGTALARFLAERGARVTVTDSKPAEALADGLAGLTGLPITLALGGHPPELLDAADIVLVSPGVPLEIPLLKEAQRRRVPLSSETRLFTRLCPAPVIGITGSSGKTTTTALVGKILEASGRRTWVGGNIGRPLIGHVGEIAPGDAVVMELSSFQLEFFGTWGREVLHFARSGRRAEEQGSLLFDPSGWSPQIAAILNITPNHLDRHPTMETYIAAKAHILAEQEPGDVAVLNLDDAVTRQMGEEILRFAHDGERRVAWFSLDESVAEGAFLRGAELVVRSAEREVVVCQADEVRLIGRHNLANLLAACALAGAAGAPVKAMRQTATTFAGVEHRLELVRERGGVRWYNDSIATSPERTAAALRAFEAPMVLLAGGRDKHLPWEEMAALTQRKVRHLILFGEAAGLIEQAMQAAGRAEGACEIHQAGTLEGAVEIAAHLAQPGDVVLLSPGGTSFDAYRDFVARGEHFRELVEALE
ncbi:MAG: UDP-N-acetylmuramoyl-L-alanine--D-glutamate ligase [Anaerolineae bacterium]|nr:UDP-N-acetylmuramoyl-L-alanine--D-glutamate ligase [Anaerolineae bacterium]